MSKPTEIVIVLGTRPEIIKLAPVIRECERRNIDYTVIHTGQHYSDSLDGVFFEQLELPMPEHNLRVGSASHAHQTAAMMTGIEDILQEEQPDTVLVQGDTNSVLAGSIAASKLNVDLGHVEAGLRSFDRSMPEETNRVLTDHVADYLFAPTDQSRQYLLDEGLPYDQIFVTGNTVVDALQQNRELAERKSDVLTELDLERGEFGLMTAHRAENVDNEGRFRDLLEGVGRAAEEYGFDVAYPIHPRAKNNLADFNIQVPERIRVIDPQDYLDFLTLESSAAVILTDSGGVQEEACILGVPCVTLRESTERPETIDVGANRLVGSELTAIVDGVQAAYSGARVWENPFGDGTAAERILTAVSPTLETETEVIQ